MRNKRLIALVMTFAMLITTLPSSVLGSSLEPEATEEMPVIDVELSEENQEDASANTQDQEEYLNDLDISPDSAPIEDIAAIIEKEGHAYLSVDLSEDSKLVVFKDADKTEELFNIVKSIILYADEYNNNMLHVRFLNQENNLVEGFISSVNFKVLTDKEASDYSKIYNSEAKDGVLLFVAEAENNNTETITEEITEEVITEEVKEEEIIVIPSEDIIDDNEADPQESNNVDKETDNNDETIDLIPDDTVVDVTLSEDIPDNEPEEEIADNNESDIDITETNENTDEAEKIKEEIINEDTNEPSDVPEELTPTSDEAENVVNEDTGDKPEATDDNNQDADADPDASGDTINEEPDTNKEAEEASVEQDEIVNDTIIDVDINPADELFEIKEGMFVLLPEGSQLYNCWYEPDSIVLQDTIVQIIMLDDGSPDTCFIRYWIDQVENLRIYAEAVVTKDSLFQTMEEDFSVMIHDL